MRWNAYGVDHLDIWKQRAPVRVAGAAAHALWFEESAFEAPTCGVDAGFALLAHRFELRALATPDTRPGPRGLIEKLWHKDRLRLQEE